MNKFTDFFNICASSLREKKLFLFDMDGTIYNEDSLFSGTKELLCRIHEMGGRYVFITNNSSKSVEEYIKKIKNFGIKADKDNFFTSTQAVILYLKKMFPKALVYCQGTVSFITELRQAGIHVTEDAESDANVILVGFDLELTTPKIVNTCKILKKDIPFFATNPDLVCPVEFGYIPDCGSICQMLENATGRRPVYIGKPEPTMVDTVREKFCVSKEETVVVGDRLYTDIAVGLNAKIDAVCVLTGETTVHDIERTEIKPTYTFESVKDIYEILK